MKIFIYFLIISLLGTILHFTYDLSGKSKFVGIFSSVNESTYEHIKLILSSIFIVNTIYYILGYQHNYFVIMLISIIIAFLLISVLYYGYKYIYKKDSAIYNISIFYITTLMISVVSYKIYKLPLMYSFNRFSMYACLLIFIFYLYATIFPPHCFFFKDPVNNTYGMK